MAVQNFATRSHELGLIPLAKAGRGLRWRSQEAPPASHGQISKEGKGPLSSQRSRQGIFSSDQQDLLSLLACLRGEEMPTDVRGTLKEQREKDTFNALKFPNVISESLCILTFLAWAFYYF